MLSYAYAFDYNLLLDVIRKMASPFIQSNQEYFDLFRFILGGNIVVIPFYRRELDEIDDRISLLCNK